MLFPITCACLHCGSHLGSFTNSSSSDRPNLPHQCGALVRDLGVTYPVSCQGGYTRVTRGNRRDRFPAGVSLFMLVAVFVQARAKLELRETATKSDAEDVVEVMKHSLANTYSDGLGNLDFERSQLGSGMSQRSAAKRLVNALHQHAHRTGQKQFDVQTLRSTANRVNIKVLDFEGLLSSLNEQGFLLKKGPQLYQLQTV